jgi:small subunit ribosomal protein S27e
MATKFVAVKCEKCKNEQMIFEKPAMAVKCLVCGETLSEPTGGRGRIMVSKAEPKSKKSEAA